MRTMPRLEWFDVDGNKRCCHCKQFLPKEQYSVDKKGVEGLAYNCKECAKFIARRSHANRVATNPDYRERKSESYVRSRWGMSRAEYIDKRDAQNGCAICREKSTANWHLDHCHSSGKIRDFLCGNCNRGLGQFNDNEELMFKAIEYLRKHRELAEEGSGP